MNYLNLGCGGRYHKNWTNVDFVSSSKDVIAHNLLKGIPFPDCTFDVVYHSHVLEHFTKPDGIIFLKECYRVLKPGGVIRIAVPDLEIIIKNYISILEKAKQGDKQAMLNYDWILLELYDQTVRNKSGGDMVQYLHQDELLNEEFIYSRIGGEARQIRNNYLNNLKKETSYVNKKNKPSKLRYFKLSTYLNFFKKNFKNNLEEITAIGKFRLGGEIHQWMYDSYSLKKLLSDIGFISIEQKSVYESGINNWENFQLEVKDGVVFKPDSLFMEALKK